MTDNWTWITNELLVFMSDSEAFVQFGLRLFPETGCTVGSIVPMALNNASTIQSALSGPTTDAQTPIVAALSDIVPAFGDPNEAQYVLLITDGDENCSSEDLPTLVQANAGAGIDTFVIGIGNGANPAVVNAIAAAGRTGPTGYIVANETALGTALADIADRIRRCVCMPLATDCVDGDFQECSSDGFSFTTETCADDGKQCTNDACNPDLGCNWPDNTLTCSDGDDCTVGDHCAGGICESTPSACWFPTSTVGAPAGRHLHTAVWTGSEMIVWGGYNDPAGGSLGTGGRYNPVTDSWSPVTTNGAPAPRRKHTAVWTGTEMIIWGGWAGEYTDSGGRYNPTSDSWSAMSTLGAPEGRDSHIAVWTGTEMIVWGGYGAGGYYQDGGRYDPLTDTWTAVTSVGAPPSGVDQTAIWTGTEMLVWGGYAGGETLAEGGRYQPLSNSWSATSLAGAPEPRSTHTAVWTGSKMLVWGGGTHSVGVPGTGGAYNPGDNTWAPIPETSAPEGRSYHTAVWTGSEMIMWGGYTNTCVATGGHYDPGAGTWSPVVTDGAPSARYRHTAVWTGSEMIIWGGGTITTWVATGGRYRPL